MLLDDSMHAELSSIIGQFSDCFAVFVVVLTIHAHTMA